ncbi:hypothetical protein MMC27_001291 [Xylographa pallens]|nr:hypothetical protein [Xylographa pallens]
MSSFKASSTVSMFSTSLEATPVTPTQSTTSEISICTAGISENYGINPATNQCAHISSPLTIGLAVGVPLGMLVFALVGVGLFRERTLRARLEKLADELRCLEIDKAQKANEWDDQPEVRVLELGNGQKRTPELGSGSNLLIPQMKGLDGNLYGFHEYGAGTG